MNMNKCGSAAWSAEGGSGLSLLIFATDGFTQKIYERQRDGGIAAKTHRKHKKLSSIVCLYRVVIAPTHARSGGSVRVSTIGMIFLND